MVLRLLPVLVFAMIYGLAIAAGQPGFQSFPATPDGASHDVVVQLADLQSREFATVLQDAAHRPADFAGHYILASWGCGASCIMAAAIDTHTGAVVWLPFTVCCWRPKAKEPLAFDLRSRLLVVHGKRNEVGDGTYFYVLNGKSFDLIR